MDKLKVEKIKRFIKRVKDLDLDYRIACEGHETDDTLTAKDLSEIDYMAIDEIWVFVDSDMWYMGEKSKEEFIFSLEVANKLLKDCEEILNNRIR